MSAHTMLTANFALEEFAVSASFPHLVEPVPEQYRANVERLATTILQPIRDHLGVPVRITSGYRSLDLNEAVGGSRTSQHRRAEAADITVGNAALLAVLLRRMVGGEFTVPCGQAILYPSRSFLHIALPSARYPAPSYHVHEPKRGLHYFRVLTVAELDDVLHRVRA